MFSATRDPVPHCPLFFQSQAVSAVNSALSIQLESRARTHTEPAHSDRHHMFTYERLKQARKESQRRQEEKLEEAGLDDADRMIEKKLRRGKNGIRAAGAGSHGISQRQHEPRATVDSCSKSAAPL